MYCMCACVCLKIILLTIKLNEIHEGHSPADLKCKLLYVCTVKIASLLLLYCHLFLFLKAEQKTNLKSEHDFTAFALVYSCCIFFR